MPLAGHLQLMLLIRSNTFDSILTQNPLPEDQVDGHRYTTLTVHLRHHDSHGSRNNSINSITVAQTSMTCNTLDAIKYYDSPQDNLLLSAAAYVHYHRRQRQEEMADGSNNSSASLGGTGEEAFVEKKYGGMVPKKPLISKDQERAYFDSADWVLGKQAANSGNARAATAIESLKPKLKRTPHHQLPRRKPTCASS